MALSKFDQALRKMPRYLTGFDPLVHISLDDLHWIAQLQVDLWDEGDNSEIKTVRQYRAVKNWMAHLYD